LVELAAFAELEADEIGGGMESILTLIDKRSIANDSFYEKNNCKTQFFFIKRLTILFRIGKLHTS
jgi:hypothetical protein